jgi:peptidoglycan-N-acetylglucosamine deacetylase
VAEAFPEIVRDLVARGHTVAVHGYFHTWRSFLRPNAARSSIEKTRLAVAHAAGVMPRFFRPPYGVITPATAKAARQTGMAIVGWTWRAFDTVFWANSHGVFSRLSRHLMPGVILAMHDAPEKPGGRCPVSLTVLEQLLNVARQKGLMAVGLDELVSSEL